MFQSTPARERATHVSEHVYPILFQSTPARERATEGMMAFTDNAKFQSTPARERATLPGEED